MQQKIRLGLGNVGANFGGTETIPIIKLWEEVDEYFTHYKLCIHSWGDWSSTEEYEISLDASNLITFLHATIDSENDYADYLKIFSEGRKKRYWCHLDIEVEALQNQKKQRSSLFRCIGLFLQQLYLSMNLCVQGAGNFSWACFPDNPEADAPLDLYNGHLESAWMGAREWGWPNLINVSFPQVWNWWDSIGFYELDIAKTAPQKAAFVLLEISSKNKNLGPNEILLISQVLESFFVDEQSNIGKILKRRLGLVLGQPSSHKNGLSKFYDLRSRIIHGDHPIIRPTHYQELDEDVENHISEYFTPIDKTLAVILAILQDLIIHSSIEYEFKETFNRSKLP